MADRDDDRFRPKLGRIRAKDGPAAQRLASRVVKVANVAGVQRATGASLPKRLSQFHRGVAAAQVMKQPISPRDRRVLIKSRLVNLKRIGLRSTQIHLRYLERDGVTKEGGRGQAYGPSTDHADTEAFEQRGREDRHQFRFIVSPEDANDLADLREFTRGWMGQVEKDLGTRLDWVAVDHWNTDNPHTHIVLRGKETNGRDLVIARDYLSHGMRARASQLATQWLGPRTEREIQASLTREVGQERWTSLDIEIQARAVDNRIDVRRPAVSRLDQQRQLVVGRLQVLARLGLAREVETGIWTLDPRAEQTLRAAGERGDIIRTMQRAMGGRSRPMDIFDERSSASGVVGRVLDKGLIDELDERSYLIVDGLDGRAHYVRLTSPTHADELSIGSLVEVRGAQIRSSDRTVLAQAVDGVYDPAKHLATARITREASQADEFVAAHVRRLEALRRAGVVERLPDGKWRVPADLPDRGRAYDANRIGAAEVRPLSPLSLDRQVRAIGAAWLDHQLVDDPAKFSERGFGAEVRSALRARLAFLVDQGFAERRDGRVVLQGNLLGSLRDRELTQTGRALATEMGLAYRPTVDGQRVQGTYRRSVWLASGRFALLEDGPGFALVPWRPVLEKRLGQAVSGIVQGATVSWDLTGRRGLSR